MSNRKRNGPGVNKQHQELPPEFKKPKIAPAKKQEEQKIKEKKQLEVDEEELDHIPLESKSTKKPDLRANERLEESSDDALAELEAAEDPEAAFDAPADDYDSAAEADIAPFQPDAKEQGKKKRKQAEEAEAEAGAAEFDGVVYIGHIPYGFFERPLRAYLRQFGAVRHLRLARNRRTGRSKHYAFVQFEDPAVARVVADTMNGYFLYGRTLVVQPVPPERVHPATFWMADRKFRAVPHRALARTRHNRPRDRRAQKGRAHHLVLHENRKRALLAHKGIAYTFPGYAGQVRAAAHALEHQEAKAVQKAAKRAAKSAAKGSAKAFAKDAPAKGPTKHAATPAKGSVKTPAKDKSPASNGKAPTTPAASSEPASKKAKGTPAPSAATPKAKPAKTSAKTPAPAKSPASAAKSPRTKNK